MRAAAEIIGQGLAAGGQIAVGGPDLVLVAFRPSPTDLLDRLKAHKTDILAALPAPTLTIEGGALVPYTQIRSPLPPADARRQKVLASSPAMAPVTP